MRPISKAVAAAALAFACAACAHVSEENRSDPAIRARIENQLRGRRDLDLSHVSIDVYGGVVTISGLVPSQSQLRAIGRLVDHIPGVEQTINNLIVQEE